ncbi:alpha/beta hydrolase [Georgenia sp. EYE_87]|uniref:alpha/beta fold hydrolase n=1 Tax=Georgenia sp. EYE_87 TaxID=2853448 RepID=UPI00200474EF|nr:alpha/beta fold hydrolase [Georgenia sp. EYE_87]MCK6212445.1 alpha/beta hydrolase [Georgenia sp. EYE_87]
MDRVDVDGLSIAYERVGEGPALVLLHGFVGDARSTWRRQLEALADEFTVVAWDAPGAGRSDDPPEGFGMAGYADTLAGFLDRLGLHRPHVAGVSFGGALALALLGRHPDLPATLVLTSAYAGWVGSLPAEVARRRLEDSLALAESGGEELEAALMPTMFAPGTPRAVVEEFAAAVRASHPDGFRSMARASATDLREVLPRVHVPTLVVHGDRDTRAPRTVADHLHAAIAGSTLTVLPGAGHLCQLEAPVAYNRAVRTFLRSAGPAQSGGASGTASTAGSTPVSSPG